VLLLWRSGVRPAIKLKPEEDRRPVRETGMSEGTVDVDGSNMLPDVDRRCIIGGAVAVFAAAREGDIKFSLVCDRRGAAKSRDVDASDMSGTFWRPAALLRRHPPKLCEEPPREGDAAADEKPGDCGGGLPNNDVDEPFRVLMVMPLPVGSPSLEPFRVSGAENKLDDGRRSTGAAGPEFLQLEVKSAPRLPRRCTGA